MTEQEADQMEQQAETIKALWVQNEKLSKRVDDLQGMHEHNQAYIKKLKEQLKPSAIAERIFGEAEQCQEKSES